MDELIKVAVLEDDLEAQMLESLLKEMGIPHVFKCYHDAAYDGLFQGQRGWGHVEAAPEQEPEILQLLHDLRAQDDPPPQ